MSDNPQAYPCLDSSCGELSMRDPGMTLRDYFAGQALAGWLASYDGHSAHPCESGHDTASSLARLSYQLSDAMLAERKSHEADRAFKEAL